MGVECNIWPNMRLADTLQVSVVGEKIRNQIPGFIVVEYDNNFAIGIFCLFYFWDAFVGFHFRLVIEVLQIYDFIDTHIAFCTLL